MSGVALWHGVDFLIASGFIYPAGWFDFAPGLYMHCVDAAG